MSNFGNIKSLFPNQMLSSPTESTERYVYDTDDVLLNEDFNVTLETLLSKREVLTSPSTTNIHKLGLPKSVNSKMESVNKNVNDFLSLRKAKEQLPSVPKKADILLMPESTIYKIMMMESNGLTKAYNGIPKFPCYGLFQMSKGAWNDARDFLKHHHLEGLPVFNRENAFNAVLNTRAFLAYAAIGRKVLKAAKIKGTPFDLAYGWHNQSYFLLGVKDLKRVEDFHNYGGQSATARNILNRLFISNR